MECITEVVFDVGSLYAHFQEMKDTGMARGMRYKLVTVLVMMVIAKLCGEDMPSGIADWVKYRAEQFIEMLKLKRKTMLHHSAYRRISEDEIDIEELEGVVSTNGVAIFTSECSKYLESFNEIPGIAVDQLTTDYWFTTLDDLG
jgi:hypothetical protein